MVGDNVGLLSSIAFQLVLILEGWPRGIIPPKKMHTTGKMYGVSHNLSTVYVIREIMLSADCE